MKKVFVIGCMVAMGLVAQAQEYFVGGSIGFGTISNGDESSNSYTFSPMAGKILSDDLYVGARLTISGDNWDNGQNPASTTKTSTVGIGGFVRYYAIRFNKFALCAEGGLGVEVNKTKREVVGDILEDGKSTTLRLEVVPLLTYNASDKVELFAELNVARFHFSNTSVKDGNSSSVFGLGADMDDTVGPIGNLTVGAIFKF